MNYNIRKSVKKTAYAALIAAPLAITPSVWALAPDQATLDAAVQSKSTGVSIVSTSGTSVNVNSTVDAAVISWKSFGNGTNNIVKGDTVAFNLPSSGSAILNRVLENKGTTIDGKITSNGKVFIMNESGVTVGANAEFNVAGLGLTTLAESEGYFLINKDLSYVGTAAAAVDVTGAAKFLTVTKTGNIVLAGNSITNVAGTVDGNLIVRASANTGSANVQLAGGALDLTISGNLDVSTTGGVANGKVTLGDGVASKVTVNGTSATIVARSAVNTTAIESTAGSGFVAQKIGSTVTLNANGGNVDLVGSANNFLSVGILNAGAVSLTDASNQQTKADGTTENNTNSSLALQALTANKLTVTANGASSVTQTGALTITKHATEAALDGSVNINASAASQRILLGNADNAIAGKITLNAGAANPADNNAIINLVAKGDLVLESLTATKGAEKKWVSISTTGNVTQSAALATAALNLRVTTTGASTIKLDNAGNDFARTTINAGTGKVEVSDGNGLIIDGLNIKGEAVIATNRTAASKADTSIGKLATTDTAAKLTLNVGEGSVLSVTANNADQDKVFAGKVVVNSRGGSANLTQFTTLGTVSANLTKDLSLGAGVVAAGNLTIGGALRDDSKRSSAAVDLGDLTVGSLVVRTVGGDITDSGVISAAGTTILQAGFVNEDGTTPLFNITLDSAKNVFTGDVSGVWDNSTYYTDGRVLANNVTLVSEGNLSLGASDGGAFTGWYITGQGNAKIAGNLSLTVANAATGGFEAITLKGVTVGGATTLVSEGAITAIAGQNRFGTSLSVTAGQNVAVNAVADLALKSVKLAKADTAADYTATFTAANGGIKIGATGGSIVSDFTGLTTFDAATAENKTITDEVDNISISGGVSFITKKGAITINNAGHSFGLLAANSSSGGDGANVEIREAATLHIDSINTGKNNVKLTSDGGDIIQSLKSTGLIATDSDGAGDASKRGTDSFIALNGAVVLQDAAAKNNTIGGEIAIQAKSDLSSISDTAFFATTAQRKTGVKQAGVINLGNVKVSEGGLSVTTTNLTDKAIVLASGKTVWVHGAGVFTAGDGVATATKIDLNQSGNNFGALTLSTSGASGLKLGTIDVKEGGTLNLKQVTTASLTATSENANVIDTGSTAAEVIKATTTVLNAASGTSTVILDVADNELGAVTVKSGGDSYVTTKTGNITIGSETKVGGNLSIRAGAGDILQSGSFEVTGAAFFDAGANNEIKLISTNNRFGTLQFFGKKVTIIQNNDMKLVSGSVATGAVDLTTSNGSISCLTATGSNNFQDTVNLNATGTIVLEDVFRISKQLTVFSNATKDLSKLTITGTDLSGLAPINLGTGAYIKPQD